MTNPEQIKNAIDYILKSILPKESQITTSVQEMGHSLFINVTCQPELAGQIIGKEGRIIKSIRQIVGLFSTPINIQVNAPNLQ